MLRDESEFPPTQKLPRELDKWRSPVGGFPGRSVDMFLAMEAVLPRTTPFSPALGVPRLCGVLAALLGDHRVTISTHLKFKDLRHSKLGWRYQQYHASLQFLLSWLATDDAWMELAPLGNASFSVESHRGGGSRGS